MLDAVPAAPRIVYRDTPDKAYVDLAVPDTVYVDRRFFGGLSDDAKKLVTWHEQAHFQNTCAKECDGKPKGCERCADKRMGICAAKSGWNKRRFLDAAKELTSQISRPTIGQDSFDGFYVAFNKRALSTTAPHLFPNSGMTDSSVDNVLVPSDDVVTVPVEGEVESDMSDNVLAPAPSPAVGDADVDDRCAYDCGWLAAAFGAGLLVQTIIIFMAGDK